MQHLRPVSERFSTVVTSHDLMQCASEWDIQQLVARRLEAMGAKPHHLVNCTLHKEQMPMFDGWRYTLESPCS